VDVECEPLARKVHLSLSSGPEEQPRHGGTDALAGKW
jgi:hypothetical protein